MADTPLPQLVGQAENALRAVLGELLAGSGVTYHQWVLLSVTAASGRSGLPGCMALPRLTAVATAALKISEHDVKDAVAALASAGKVSTGDGDVRLTDEGQQWHAERRTAVSQATGTLMRDVPAVDMAATSRVLTTVTRRANLLLTRSIPTLDSFLAYRDSGNSGESGPAVVFLHGNPTSSYLWRDILPQVCGQARVLAPDLVGMGGSGKPRIDYSFADHARYLDAWFDALDLDDVILVGHDWGGALALDRARRHPSEVRGIVLLETFLRPMSWVDYTEPARGFFEALRTPGVGEQLVHEENFFIQTALPATTRDLSARAAAYAAPFIEPATRTPMLRWAREIPIDGTPADVHQRFLAYGDWLRSTPNVPKLLLTVEAGGLVTPEIERWARDHVAALEVDCVGPAGHHAPEEQPDTIARTIRAWLDRHHLTANHV